MTADGYEAGEGPLALDQIQPFTQDLKVIIAEKSPVFAESAIIVLKSQLVL